MSDQQVSGSTPTRSADPLAEYRVAGRQTALLDPAGHLSRAAYDELVAPDGRIRPMWKELAADFAEQGSDALSGLSTRVRRLIDDDGITYTEIDLPGEAATLQAHRLPAAQPTPWRLDPVPLLVSVADWTALEAGLVQRSRLLDAVLADIYGARRTITSGLLPPEVVFGHAGYVRAAHGITLPGRHQLFLHGCDVSRWADGGFRVSADWTQAPSGAGYALADRRVVASAIPEALEHSGPRPLTPFVRAMRLMLLEAAPSAVDDEPTVVVLSPGSHSETAFDQAYLASALGFPLVESADLVVRDGFLWMRSLGTLERVDVVLRRVDAQFVDPLDLRPDSQLGVVGLVEVLRRGAVAVVNTLGSGVLENPALACYLPGLAAALLDEEMLLPSAPAYWGGEPKQRAHLLANLDRLCLRSTVDGTTVDVARMPSAERAELIARIEAHGWQWVGQEPAQHAVAPAVGAPGRLTAGPVGMRLFALARRGGYTPLAGGLGQLLEHREDGVAQVVAAKDVWVRAVERIVPVDTRVAASGPQPEHPPAFRAPGVDVVSSPRVLGDLFWMGRYGERAEAAARLLATTYDVYQDFRYRPWLDGSECLPVLLRALGRVTGTMFAYDETQAGSARDELVSLTVDQTRAGSLAYAVHRYGQAARSVRDQLSHDTWMVLSGADRAIASYTADVSGGRTESASDNVGKLSAVHSAVLAGMLALSGVGAESMVHDSGWYVMDIGKRIERGLTLATLLRAALTTQRTESLDRLITESVLRATESSVTFRRRHHGRTRLAAVAQLLLFDQGNPRSLAYQLITLAADLRALPGMSGSSRPQRLVAEASALLSRVDPAELETVDATGERRELAKLLDAQLAVLRAVSESFEATKLSRPGAIQPLWGTTKVVQ